MVAIALCSSLADEACGAEHRRRSESRRPGRRQRWSGRWRYEKPCPALSVADRFCDCACDSDHVIEAGLRGFSVLSPAATMAGRRRLLRAPPLTTSGWR